MKSNMCLSRAAILFFSLVIIWSCDDIVDDQNNPPQINDQTFEITENSQNGMVVDTIVASDEDEDQELFYFVLTGNSNNAFNVDSITGVITVMDSSHLDFEINPFFELGIKVTDNAEIPLSSFATITINLEDVEEPEYPTKGLVAYYPFNGHAKDKSGNCNHGIVNNAQLAQDRKSNPNSSYYFNGSNAYISVPSHPTLNPENQLTINMWISVEELNNRYTPVIHKGGTYQTDFTNREYVVYVEDNNKIFAESSGDNKPHRFLNSEIPSLKEWFMFTAVIDRENHKMKTYINGVLKKEKDDDYSSFTNNNDSIRIASWVEENASYAPFFKGKVDDIRIYDRSLDEDEISLLYEE